MTDRITIAIACYNAESTIGRALASAQAQDWPDTEILVVDDASTDDGPARVAAEARRDIRVKLIRHRENQGAGATRQTLLDAATGLYIAFFDDDDESDPARLRRQHARLVTYAQRTGACLVACYASGVRVYPNGYRLNLPAIGSQPAVPTGDAVAEYLLFNRRATGLFYGSGTPTCALFAPVATLRAAGGFDPDQRRVEDADLAIRLAQRGAHFVGCPERLFTQYATEASDKSALANYQAELRLIDKNRLYLERRRRYGYARRWCRVRYRHFAGDRRGFLMLLAGTALRYPAMTATHLLRSGLQRWRHERRMAASPPDGPAPEATTVLFVVTEDWYFWSHRRPMAEAARDMGLRVLVATRVNQHRAAIEAAGFELVPVAFDRGSLNPIGELRVMRVLCRTIRKRQPKIVFAVGMKPIVDTEAAALLAGRPHVVRVFAGMGAVLGRDAGLLKALVTAVMRGLAGLNGSQAVVQNADDRDELVKRGLARPDQITLIPGSGIDLRRFTPSAEPTGPVVAMFVGRLLEDKGVRELVAAGEKLKARGGEIGIWVVGDTDPANPRAIPADTIARWSEGGALTFLGKRGDIGELWRHVHIGVLPSYREGLPMSLLEAAACARPIVTTDVPGCRDLVPDGDTGILVPPRDADALADALAALAGDADRRIAMGRAARHLVESKFSRAHVFAQTQTLIQQTLGTPV